jgi:DNA polymerase-3 subunit delta'
LLLRAAPGLGALEFQLTLAQAWLCEAPLAGGLPCGRCGSCHLVQGRSHPDLRVMVPELLRVTLGWEIPGASADGETRKAKPSKQIRIEELRSVLDWIVKTSARGRAMVLVLHPAEAMNAVTANALLKTLEEPPRGARLLLSCSDPEHLLPTVRSRCQQIALPPPPTHQALAWLAAQGVPDAAVLLAACAGRPLDALALQKDGVDAAAWSSLPRSLARGHAAAWSGWPLPRSIDALQKLCHDLMAASAGAAPQFFAAASLPAAAGMAGLATWADELARAARHADHPWNEGLRVEALVAQGRRALATLRT